MMAMAMFANLHREACLIDCDVLVPTVDNLISVDVNGLRRSEPQQETLLLPVLSDT